MGGHFDPAFDWTPGMVDMKRCVDGLLDHFRAVKRRPALNLAGDVMLEVERLREDKLRLEEMLVTLRGRLQAAVAESKGLRVRLEIEEKVSAEDRVGEARKVLQLMAQKVQDAEAARNGFEKELGAARRRVVELEGELRRRPERRPRGYRSGRLPVGARDSRVVSGGLRAAVIERDGGCCRYCGRMVEAGMEHIDHVWPHSQGGLTVLENLVVACAWCNTVKSDRIGVWPRPLDGMKGMRYAYPSEAD